MARLLDARLLLAVVVLTLGSVGLIMASIGCQSEDSSQSRATAAAEASPLASAAPTGVARRTTPRRLLPANPGLASPPIGTPAAAVPAPEDNEVFGEQRPEIPEDEATVPAIDEEFQAELETFLGEREGLFGLVLFDLRTGRTVLINAERTFPSASTFKLLVMHETYRQLANGSLSPDEILTIIPEDEMEEDSLFSPGDGVTAAAALEAMITVSSNDAAYALIRRVGGWAAIEAAARELGMEQTGLAGGYFWTTPADIWLFLDALAQGYLISDEASANMLRLLRKQEIGDRIPALLPAEAIVAHKTGELPGVRNDVGIVDGPGGRFLICAFSRWVDEDEATRAIAEISRRAYDRYVR